jgi:hypothetical protein
LLFPQSNFTLTKKATVHVVVGDLLVPAHGSIQEVIEEAEDGDVIAVAPGIYEEQLVINKPLTLLGPNAGIAGYSEDRLGEATITYPDELTNNYLQLISIYSDDVTIDGFKLDDGDYSTDSVETNGIFAHGDNITVRNNNIEGFNRVQILVTSSYYDDGWKTEYIKNALVEGNYGRNALGYSAIYIQGASGIVRDNVVENAPRAIQIQPYANTGTGTVENNTLSAYWTGIFYNGAEKAAGKWEILNNTITATEGTMGSTPVYTNETWAGLEVIGLKSNEGVLFSGNKIDGQGATGITRGIAMVSGIADTAIATFTNNTFTNVDVGAYRGSGTLNLEEVLANNTFPEGSMVIGNEIKVFVPEENKVYNQNTGDEYDTIQAAINAAEEGDTILVAPGTYDATEIVITTNGITLKSIEGVENTVIAGGIELRGNDITIDGFTIGTDTTNGFIGVQGTNGSKIINNIVNGAKATVSIGNTTGNTVGSITIVGNILNGGPIGLYPTSDSVITIEDNTIDSGNGEIIWIHGAGFNPTSLTLEITGNSAVQSGDVITIHFKPVSINGVKADELDVSALQEANNRVTVKLGWVKTVGTTGADFETIQGAINAAKDGETILISAGTYEEEIIVNKDNVKSITILGANANTVPSTGEVDGTILTGGIYIGTDASALIEKSVTVKGITFYGGKGLLLGNIQTVTVENNKFINIEKTFNPSTTGVAAIAVIDPCAGGTVTIKNNYINGVQGVESDGTEGQGLGIYVRKPTTVAIIGNHVESTAHNSIQVVGRSVAPEVSIIDNTLVNWDEDRDSKGGRAIRINFDPVDDNTKIIVTGNTFSPNDDDDPTDPEYVKITGVSIADNNVNNLIYSLINDNTWPDGTDYSKVILVNDTPGTNMAASITKGDITYYYPTIQAAIDAAGEGDTIMVGPGTYEGFTVVDRKDITIKGAGEGETIILPEALLETGTAHKYTKNMKSVVFVDNSTGITIQDLTVEDNGLKPDAIVFWNASTGVIKDVAIKGTSTLTGVQTGQGIAVDAGKEETTVLEIINTDISGFNKNGIDVVDGNGEENAGGTITVNVNGGTIKGAGQTNVNGQNGIVFWDRGGGSIGGEIKGVTFKDLYYTPVDEEACAILDYRTNKEPDITVTNCTFENVEVEVYVYPEDDQTENIIDIAAMFKEDEKETEEPNITPLEVTIEAAIAAKEGVVVSVDGTDVPAGTYWVTQADMDALDAAIAAAEAAKETAETQEDVDDAVAELEAAIAAFNAAKQEAVDEEENRRSRRR